MTGRWLTTRNLSIDGKMHPVGTDVSDWARAPEFDGKGTIFKPGEAESEQSIDYASMTLNELKAAARDAGIKYYYRLKRDELVKRLSDGLLHDG